MTGFIKISNSIFDYELSPTSMFVYCAMLSRANVFKSVCITYSELSALCRMDAKTIRSAIAELQEEKLVTKSNRYNTRGYIANRYTLHVPSGSWFKLEREVFGTQIKPSAFMVYCFILKTMCEKRGGAFPSLSAICEATSLSRTTACKAVDYLNSHTFLNRLHRRYKTTKAYRHNRYIKFCIVKNGKKRERSIKRSSLKENYRGTNLSNFLRKVKSFCKNFFNTGVVHIFPNSS